MKEFRKYQKEIRSMILFFAICIAALFMAARIEAAAAIPLEECRVRILNSDGADLESRTLEDYDSDTWYEDYGFHIWNGSFWYPKPLVTYKDPDQADAEPQVLIEGKDYQLTYENTDRISHPEQGKDYRARLWITGIGDYTGRREIRWDMTCAYLEDCEILGNGEKYEDEEQVQLPGLSFEGRELRGCPASECTPEPEEKTDADQGRTETEGIDYTYELVCVNQADGYREYCYYYYGCNHFSGVLQNIHYYVKDKKTGGEEIPGKDPGENPGETPDEIPGDTPDETGSIKTDAESGSDMDTYVRSLYQTFLGRKADTKGLKNWTTLLASGRITGAQLLVGFVHSKEFVHAGKTDSDYVEELYLTVLGRPSDANGKKTWTDLLEAGCSRDLVLAGFVGSQEFGMLCQKLGIQKGEYHSERIEDRDPARTARVTAWIRNLYADCMHRKPDPEGLNNWRSVILSDRWTPQNVAECFYLSREIEERQLSDQEFLTRLYQTVLTRTPDKNGLSFWTAYLSEGGNRAQVVRGFTRSDEYISAIKKARLR